MTKYHELVGDDLVRCRLLVFDVPFDVFVDDDGFMCCGGCGERLESS